MAKSKEEPIFIGIDDQVIELTGAEKEAFLAQRKADNEAQATLDAEIKAKKEARENAIKKLAEIAGLTEDEIQAII